MDQNEQDERDKRLRTDLAKAAGKAFAVALAGFVLAAMVNTPAALHKLWFLTGVFIALWGGLLSNGDDIASIKMQNRDEILRKRIKEWLVIVGGVIAGFNGLLS